MKGGGEQLICGGGRSRNCAHWKKGISQDEEKMKKSHSLRWKFDTASQSRPAKDPAFRRREDSKNEHRGERGKKTNSAGRRKMKTGTGKGLARQKVTRKGGNNNGFVQRISKKKKREEEGSSLDIFYRKNRRCPNPEGKGEERIRAVSKNRFPFIKRARGRQKGKGQGGAGKLKKKKPGFMEVRGGEPWKKNCWRRGGDFICTSWWNLGGKGTASCRGEEKRQLPQEKEKREKSLWANTQTGFGE